VKYRGDYISTPSTVYHGWAEPGTAEGTALWRIVKETVDGSQRTLELNWVDGNTNFDNVWTARVGLIYET